MVAPSTSNVDMSGTRLAATKPIALLCTIALLLFARSVRAQCVNTATPTCGVYVQCFAKYCPCKGDPDEYFETYGKPYCDSFLTQAQFTPIGQRWRDSTLKCLQESIVPRLSISDPPSACNCKAMKSFAFDTHVGCYTQPGNSICSLPMKDVTTISSVVKTKDLISTEGLRQTARVAAICKTTAPDDGRRAGWKAISTFLQPFQ